MVGITTEIQPLANHGESSVPQNPTAKSRQVKHGRNQEGLAEGTQYWPGQTGIECDVDKEEFAG